ncbi:MAG: hypothetical protein M3425_10565 [Actinomycetota bacterium]|nr:hypothetical protein [Actinomycetota bacterium]
MPMTAADVARLSLRGSWALDRGELRRNRELRPQLAIRAARLARALAPAAAEMGGWTSTELVVRVAANPDSARRPDVCVVVGPVPAGGVVEVPPALVAIFDDEQVAGWWLRRGAGTVWVLHRCGASLLLPGRPAVALGLDDELTVADHPKLALPVHVACALRPPAVLRA